MAIHTQACTDVSTFWVRIRTLKVLLNLMAYKPYRHMPELLRIVQRWPAENLVDYTARYTGNVLSLNCACCLRSLSIAGPIFCNFHLEFAFPVATVVLIDYGVAEIQYK